MWFGTEGGLAKFDGRRTQVIKDPGLPAAACFLSKTDDAGTLWIGTGDSGAARIVGGQIENIGDTAGNAISAIDIPEPGRILFATEQGTILECRTTQNNGVQVKSLLSTPLKSADRDNPGALVITSLVTLNGKLLAGSLSRGLLEIANGGASETQSKPAGEFIRAMAVDNKGQLWGDLEARKTSRPFSREHSAV